MASQTSGERLEHITADYEVRAYQGTYNVPFYTDNPVMTPKDMWLNRELWNQLGKPKTIQVVIRPLVIEGG